MGRADRCTLDTALCPSLGRTSHTAPEPSLTSHLQSRTRRGNTAAHHTHPPMVLFYQVRSNMEIVVDVDCNQLWNLTIRIKHIGKDWKQMVQQLCKLSAEAISHIADCRGIVLLISGNVKCSNAKEI